MTGWGVVVASSAPAVATVCTAVAVGKTAVSVAVAGRGEASAMTADGVVVAVLMSVASAGGAVGETAVSCSGAQAARESKRKKQMSVTCLTNRWDRI
jgi:hypothetical protein